MSESGLRRRLSAVVRHDLDGQFTSVETAGSAGAGVPDVEICLPGGVQAWLELKVHDVSNVDRAKKISHFRQQQAKWLRDRYVRGGRAGLLIMARIGNRREYVVLDAPGAANLWIAQREHPWSWSEIRNASVRLPSLSLDADWVRHCVQGLSKQ